MMLLAIQYWQTGFYERCFAATMKQAWPEVGDGKDSCVSTSFWSSLVLGVSKPIASIMKIKKTTDRIVGFD